MTKTIDTNQEPLWQSYKLPLDVDLLTRVCEVQSSSRDDSQMREFLSNELVSLQETLDTQLVVDIDKYKNLYVTKGTLGPGQYYPAVVAHIDTVHALTDDLTVVNQDGVLFGMNMNRVRMTGIGGDDKVGIYMALEMLRYLPLCKIALFRDEEIGCLGSEQANMRFFDDTCFVLQADRRGYGDFIWNSNSLPLASKLYWDTIKPLLDRFGYKKAMGTMTDVGQLKDNGLGVSCANVSCGYYNAHSPEEYIVTDHVEACLNLFFELFTNYGDRQWPHVLTAEDRRSTSASFRYGYSGSYSGYSGYQNYFDSLRSQSSGTLPTAGGTTPTAAGSAATGAGAGSGGSLANSVQSSLPAARVSTYNKDDNCWETPDGAFRWSQKTEAWVKAADWTPDMAQAAIRSIVPTRQDGINIVGKKHMPDYCPMCQSISLRPFFEEKGTRGTRFYRGFFCEDCGEAYVYDYTRKDHNLNEDASLINSIVETIDRENVYAELEEMESSDGNSRYTSR